MLVSTQANLLLTLVFTDTANQQLVPSLIRGEHSEVLFFHLRGGRPPWLSYLVLIPRTLASVIFNEA